MRSLMRHIAQPSALDAADDLEALLGLEIATLAKRADAGDQFDRERVAAVVALKKLGSYVEMLPVRVGATHALVTSRGVYVFAI